MLRRRNRAQQTDPEQKAAGGRGARGAHLVGVPQADGAAQGYLAHQQVVHPAEGELQVPHLVLVQVPVDLPCRDKHRPRGCQQSPRRTAPSLRPRAHLGTPPTSRGTAPKEHGRKRNFHPKTSDSLPQGIWVVTAVTVTRTTTAPAGGLCAPSGMPQAPPQEHGQTSPALQTAALVREAGGRSGARGGAQLTFTRLAHRQVHQIRAAVLREGMASTTCRPGSHGLPGPTGSRARPVEGAGGPIPGSQVWGFCEDSRAPGENQARSAISHLPQSLSPSRHSTARAPSVPCPGLSAGLSTTRGKGFRAHWSSEVLGPWKCPSKEAETLGVMVTVPHFPNILPWEEPL